MIATWNMFTSYIYTISKYIITKAGLVYGLKEMAFRHIIVLKILIQNPLWPNTHSICWMFSYMEWIMGNQSEREN